MSTNISIPFEADQAQQARNLLGAASALELDSTVIRVNRNGFIAPEEVYEEYMSVLNPKTDDAAAADKAAEAEKAAANKAAAEKAEVDKAAAAEAKKPAAKKPAAKKTADKKPTKPSLDDILGDTEE